MGNLTLIVLKVLDLLESFLGLFLRFIRTAKVFALF